MGFVKTYCDVTYNFMTRFSGMLSGFCGLIWCIMILQCHLLYDSDVRRDLQNVLEEDDLSVVLNSKHRPHCMIQFISQSIQLLNVEEPKRNILVNFLPNCLCFDCCGAFFFCPLFCVLFGSFLIHFT